MATYFEEPAENEKLPGRHGSPGSSITQIVLETSVRPQSSEMHAQNPSVAQRSALGIQRGCAFLRESRVTIYGADELCATTTRSNDRPSVRSLARKVTRL